MADEDRLVVIVEAAGMRQSEFKVSVTNQRLIIVGVRPPREQAHRSYHQLEIRYGEFRTEVYLPWPVNQENIVAEYEDGFLRVELARATPSQMHVVDVRKIDAD
jgi:HSP20 family protein